MIIVCGVYAYTCIVVVIVCIHIYCDLYCARQYSVLSQFSAVTVASYAAS